MTCTLLCLACLILCPTLTAAGREILANGDDFVAYNISSLSGLPPWTRHTLTFDFKTVEPNNLLVYVGSEDELKDFVMVDLIHGKLRYDFM